MLIIFNTVLFFVWIALLFFNGRFWVRLLGMDKENALLKGTAACILGIAVFIVALNALCYALPFQTAVFTALAVNILAAVLGMKRAYFALKYPDISWMQPNRNAFMGIVIIFGLLIAFIHAGTAFYDAHFHQAVSFTLINDHFPLRWPWYPGLSLDYHYAFNLLMASTKVLTGIDMFYANDPMAIALTVSAICFVFGLIYSFTTSKWMSLWGSLTFALFYGLTVIDTLNHTVEDLRNMSNLLDLQQWVDWIIANVPQSGFLFESFRWPVVLEIPVVLMVVFLLARIFEDPEWINPVRIIITGVLTGFVALCEETLFGAIGLGMMLVMLITALTRYDLFKKVFLSLFSLGVIASMVAVLQGGVLRSMVLGGSMAADPILKSSINSELYFMAEPIGNFFDSISWKKMDIMMLLLLVVAAILFSLKYARRSKYILLVFCTIFVAGFFVAGIITNEYRADQFGRMYYFWIPSTGFGIILGAFIEKTTKTWRRIGWGLGIVLISGSLLTVTGLFIRSSHFLFFSKQAVEIRTKIKAGSWMDDKLPKNAIVFGQDPRFSGLLSLGGNKYFDHLYLDTSAVNAALAVLDINYFIKSRINYLYLDTTQYASSLILNRNLSMVPGPFEKNKVLFKINDTTYFEGNN
jgi:hypothetical protein